MDLSFGSSPIFKDGLNYWLESLIDLHCRISDFFESIDYLFDIAALLRFSFRLFASHSSSILPALRTPHIFLAFSPHFFAFFAAERSKSISVKLVKLPA